MKARLGYTRCGTPTQLGGGGVVHCTGVIRDEAYVYGRRSRSRPFIHKMISAHKLFSISWAMSKEVGSGNVLGTSIGGKTDFTPLGAAGVPLRFQQGG